MTKSFYQEFWAFTRVFSGTVGRGLIQGENLADGHPLAIARGHEPTPTKKLEIWLLIRVWMPILKRKITWNYSAKRKKYNLLKTKRIIKQIST